jgi:hypothetical protein
MHVAFVVLSLTWSTGCERLPATSAGKTSTGFHPDVVDPTWVEKTSWKAQSGGFEIKQPPLFDFISQQPRLQLLPAGEPNAKNGIANYEQPSWMDDDIYAALSSYLEPPSPFVRSFNQEVDGKSIKACVINRDGSQLMLVRDSIDIMKFDEATIQETSLPNPVNNCIDVAFVSNSSHAILHGDNRLVKISLDDGSITQQLDFPSNEGRIVCFALNSDSIGVATEHGELKVLDGQWQAGPSLAFDVKAFRVTANRKSIAMDAKGESIVAATSQGKVSTWRLRSKESGQAAIRQDSRLAQYRNLPQEEAEKVQDVVFCTDARFYSIVDDVFGGGIIERTAASGAAALALASRQSLAQPSRIIPELLEVCQCYNEKEPWFVFFRRVEGQDGNKITIHDAFDYEAHSMLSSWRLTSHC